MFNKQLTILTGAGVSAESGIKTFRDTGGRWADHKVEEVATPEGWLSNPELVIQFYKHRFDEICEAKPNKAHQLLALLEDYYPTTIITQNIDDLHERAGSSNVVHLHGEIKKVRSSSNAQLVYDAKPAYIKLGDLCEEKSQLRPNIVWFGEEVPLIETAANIAAQSDLLVIIGTSLQVYPAANLVKYTRKDCKIYLIDPKDVYVPEIDYRVHKILKPASIGCELLLNLLLKDV